MARCQTDLHGAATGTSTDVLGRARRPDYWPVVERLGFRPFDGSAVLLDGSVYTTVVLDFGPGSVDGWLAGLISAELGVESEPTIDAEARELVLHGTRVCLTPLEFGLFTCLHERDGRTVTRYELIRDVWGTDFAGGSNVVDAVVRSLRVKLGPGATPWKPSEAVAIGSGATGRTADLTRGLIEASSFPHPLDRRQRMLQAWSRDFVT